MKLHSVVYSMKHRAHAATYTQMLRENKWRCFQCDLKSLIQHLDSLRGALKICQIWQSGWLHVVDPVTAMRVLCFDWFNHSVSRVKEMTKEQCDILDTKVSNIFMLSTLTYSLGQHIFSPECVKSINIIILIVNMYIKRLCARRVMLGRAMLAIMWDHFKIYSR